MFSKKRYVCHQCNHVFEGLPNVVVERSDGPRRETKLKRNYCPEHKKPYDIVRGFGAYYRTRAVRVTKDGETMEEMDLRERIRELEAELATAAKPKRGRPAKEASV